MSWFNYTLNHKLLIRNSIFLKKKNHENDFNILIPRQIECGRKIFIRNANILNQHQRFVLIYDSDVKLSYLINVIMKLMSIIRDTLIIWKMI